MDHGLPINVMLAGGDGLTLGGMIPAGCFGYDRCFMSCPQERVRLGLPCLRGASEGSAGR